MALEHGARLGLAALSLVALVALYMGLCSYILKVTITPIRKLPTETPAQLGFPDVQEIAFNSMEDRIHLRGWFVPSTGSRAIVLVHGIHSHAWDVGLTRFRGHLTLVVEGVHDTKTKEAVSAGVSRAAGRVGSCGTYAGGSGPRV